MRALWIAALAAVLAVAACGGDDDAPTTSTDDTVDDAAPSPAVGGEWCDELRAATPASLTPAALAGAPVELRPALEALVDPPRIVGSGALPDMAPTFEALTVVAVWDEDVCGGEPAFCSMWPSFTGVLSNLTLSGAADPDVEAAARAFVAAVDDLLGAHAPGELGPHIGAFVEGLEPRDDESERRGEAAFDALQAWPGGNCGDARAIAEE